MLANQRYHSTTHIKSHVLLLSAEPMLNRPLAFLGLPFILPQAPPPLNFLSFSCAAFYVFGFLSRICG